MIESDNMGVDQRKGQWRIPIEFLATLFSVACLNSDPTSRVSYHPKDLQFLFVVDISLGGQIHRVKGEEVTSLFFSARDCRPYLGRLFSADDYSGRVVVLSYGLWQRLYGGSNLSGIGQRLNLSAMEPKLYIHDTPFVAVGVTPPSFSVPSGAELWILAFRMLLALSDSGEQAKELNQGLDCTLARLICQLSNWSSSPFQVFLRLRQGSMY